MPTFQSLKGTIDQYPGAKEAIADIERRKKVEGELVQVLRTHGFREIRTPAIELTDVFTRTSGEESDIVLKEMYTFTDKGGRSCTLKPEITAPIVRSLVQHRWDIGGVKKLFYFDRCYRYNRPQKGRLREFQQVGIEIFDQAGPAADVEGIALAVEILEKLKVGKTTLLLNTIGTAEDRARFVKALKAFLEPKKESLSEDSQKRLDSNVLRILDSKAHEDQEALEGAPVLSDYLAEESQIRFKRVCELLDRLEIQYVIEPKLVRGLDYYCHTVFEITTESLGAQATVIAGGRYDTLVKEMGGPEMAAFGWACGIERLLLTLADQNLCPPIRNRTDIYLIPLEDGAVDICFEQMIHLRRQGIRAEMCHKVRAIGKQLKSANQFDARLAGIIGEEELANEQVSIKNLDNQTEKKVAIHDLQKYVQSQIS
ncbi:MAG: Histidine--tRNA ligase [Chlamydiia bacterium]|nr:Histidine--tRNA ligase [Chlamydiia bacterium]